MALLVLAALLATARGRSLAPPLRCDVSRWPWRGRRVCGRVVSGAACRMPAVELCTRLPPLAILSPYTPEGHPGTVDIAAWLMVLSRTVVAWADFAMSFRRDGHKLHSFSSIHFNSGQQGRK